ncbi:MAG: AAA family ATPase [Elusimicrobiales bacterium]|nr:AAA family ATPase [Elusimicrobiales bacterium]
MLEKIYIKNFAIIDNLEVNFTKGLNIISGETGAGKSIIVESISFLFGSRLTFKDLKDNVHVKAVFKINGKDIIIERIYDKNFKSKYFINSKQVPFSEIEDLRDNLIDFHSQFENLSIFRNDYQISILDKYCDIEKDVVEYSKFFRERENLLLKLSMLEMSEEERKKLIEIRNYQISELENASLKDGEDLEIENKILSYKNRIKIFEKLSYISSIISNENGVSDLIAKCLKKVEDLREYEDFYELYLKIEFLANEIKILNENITEKINYYSVDENIDSLIARDELIKKLKKKYNVVDVKGLLSKLDLFKKELENLNNLDLNIELLKKEIRKIEIEMEKMAECISKKRRQAAAGFSKDVLDILKELDLKNSRFDIIVEESDEFNVKGKNYVEFLFSANPDYPLKPIKDIASGGELSRIIISLKSVLSNIVEQSVMILDEIDTGIGGNTAFKIGKVMKEVSKKTQIICITHMPQIAVFGDNHIKVIKDIIAGKTKVMVSFLIEDVKRIEEIARMFGSEYSPNTAKAHAIELFRRCKKY